MSSLLYYILLTASEKASTSAEVFVNESEAEIGLSLLEDPVILHGYARQLGQLLGGKALRFPQVLDSACHFFQIGIQWSTPFVSGPLRPFSRFEENKKLVPKKPF